MVDGLRDELVHAHPEPQLPLGLLDNTGPPGNPSLPAIADSLLARAGSLVWAPSFFAFAPTTDSTMDLARRLAAGDHPAELQITQLGGQGPHFLTLAYEQTAGRGRHGRAWASPRGSGVYATVSLLVDCPQQQLAGLSLAVGVGVRRAASELGVEALLKWPNDVLVLTDEGPRKLAGILIEVSPAAHGSWVHIGVGLNILESVFPTHIPATTLADRLEHPPSYEVAVSTTIAHTLHALDQFFSAGFPTLRDEWNQACAALGAATTVRSGGNSVSGLVAGCGDDGALLLETDRGLTPVYSGEIG